MSNRRASGTGRGIALGLLFAILRVLIGGVVGCFAFTPHNSLRDNPDPQAQAFAKLFTPIDACFGFVGMLIGGGVGGTIGGIAGGVLGARSAARKNAALSSDDSSGTIEDSRDDEAARLEAQVARLQDRIDDLRRDDRFQAGEDRSPGSPAKEE
jgi:hypothetical protein